MGEQECEGLREVEEEEECEGLKKWKDKESERKRGRMIRRESVCL